MEINLRLLTIVVSCSFWGCIFLSYLDKMYERKYERKVIYRIALLIFVSLFILINLLGIPFLNSIYAFCSVSILTLILYNRSGKVFLLYNTYFVVFMIFIDVLTVLLFSAFSVDNIDEVLNNDFTMFLTSVPMYIIVLVLHGNLVKLFQHKKISKVSIMENTFLIVEVFFEVIVITYIASFVKTESNILMFVFITIGFFITNFVQIFLFYYSSSYQSLKREMMLYEQQSIMMAKHYDEIEEKYRQSRKLFHDINNHIHIMEKLYKEGNEKIASEYEKDVKEKLENLDYRFKYENRILNLLINDKYKVCEAKQIALVVNVQDIYLGFFSDFDLTTIFGNLLDNAVDACDKIEDIEKRKVEIRIHEFNNYIVVAVWNSIKELPQKMKGKFITTKKGHLGIGLSNVEETINKYNGTIKYEYTEEHFNVKLIIPQPEE